MTVLTPAPRLSIGSLRAPKGRWSSKPSTGNPCRRLHWLHVLPARSGKSDKSSKASRSICFSATKQRPVPLEPGKAVSLAAMPENEVGVSELSDYGCFLSSWPSLAECTNCEPAMKWLEAACPVRSPIPFQSQFRQCSSGGRGVGTA